MSRGELDNAAPAMNGERLPIILIVDDQPENLATMAEIVRLLEVGVRVANSGPGALELAALAPQPDLILLDILMPGMDGHQVLAELRRTPATRDIPVIFVSALDDAQDEQLGLSAGAADYIVKPIKPAILLARVRAQLELKKARDLLAGQKSGLEQEVQRRVSENTLLANRLQLALQASGIGIWEHHRQTGENTWNETMCALLGDLTPPASIGEYLALVHPDDRDDLAQACASGPHEGDDVLLPAYRMRHRHGHWVWLEGRGQTLRRPSGDSTALITIGTMTDISRRKADDAERLLAAAIVNGINDGICVTDAGGKIVLTNPAFTTITGYSAAEVHGRNPSLLHSGLQDADFYRAMWAKIAHDGNWQGEISNRRKNGTLLAEWLSISAVSDDKGQVGHYVGVFNDLSERKAAAERIQYLTSYDALTRLPNRNLFTDRLDQALLTAHRYLRGTALILLDLDRFRFLNDTLGAPVGDAVLCEVARRLSLQVREGDTVGRLSGNEFGFVMANLGQERDAIALAQRMLEAIAAPFQVAGQSIVITASIGISIAPKDGDSSEALLKGADAGLLRAKQAGRNAFRFYSSEMDADAARRLGLEAALRDALAKNEMAVHYQPQVSLDTGKLLGMEALLRWNNDHFGPVSPAEFIPIAEESGQIIAIGEWVLRQACQQTKTWLDLGLANLRVAVNLSTKQFRAPNLLAMVRETLQASGLPASALELEITESAFIDDTDGAIALCKEIKSAGIKLSLDDFGTGYSSLAYISRFPFDKIKIDQGFVRDIIENPVNAAIATAAIVMARSLNLTVLAEGVETEAQASFLRGRRCDAMQGYLFSRPLPAADFTTLLLGNKQMAINATPSTSLPTLLLVDDEQNILNALSRLFRREGYRILTATSALVGFELLAQNPVQVVLCDQRMPEMSGSEFLARVRQLYPDTVRLVLTGYTDLESVTAAINKGAVFKFLTKPWDDDELRERIREAFRIANDLKQGGG